MLVKICGLKSLEDIGYANTYKPDLIGFIFHKPSHRYISYETAKDLKSNLDENIKAVGVFVDRPTDEIIDAFERECFDIVQLHGKEDQGMIETLKAHSIPVIKAVRIKDSNSLKALQELKPDLFLFDIYSNSLAGGTGESFDWSILDQVDIPYFLAGGIDINNVDEALQTPALGLDISSGVETNKKKDKEKIKEIISRIRNYG